MMCATPRCDIRRGENFKILELNGAASEATSIYDTRNSLFRAYAILFRQWDLVFAIGAANRKLGHRPAALAPAAGRMEEVSAAQRLLSAGRLSKGAPLIHVHGFLLAARARASCLR